MVWYGEGWYLKQWHALDHNAKASATERKVPWHDVYKASCCYSETRLWGRGSPLNDSQYHY